MDTVTNVSAFGIKQGTFTVDANGAANYQLPIDIPPGIAQAQPNLQLLYNHGAGNGVCGIGWGLSGLSSITRTNAIPAIDGFWGSINYNDNDRFALDGQRLINITGDYGAAGTIYYTENHQWTQVVAGASPLDGFTVYKKNGAIWSYGTTQDSCILAHGSSTNVREWALASIQDLNGNRVEYHYTTVPVAGGKDTGAYYLSSISYTVTNGNQPLFAVNFGYAARPDVITTYLGGYLVQTSYLLSTIQTTMGSEPVRTYTLTYGQGTATGFSRIDGITSSDANGNTLPPVQISWQDVAQPGFDTSQASSQLLHQSGVVQTSPVDVNGDGITDILQFYLGQGNLYVVTYLATLQSGQVSYSTTNSGGQSLGHYTGTIGTNYYVFTADVNGDGLSDIVVAYPGGANNQLVCIDVFINNGATFSSAYTTSTSDHWQGTSSLGFFAIDANGDGRVDLVQAYTYNGFLNFNTWISNYVGSSGGFSTKALGYEAQYKFTNPVFWPMDVNNDGITDMVVLWQNSSGLYQVTSFITTDTPGGLNLFTTQVSSNLNAPSNGTLSILPVDVNGDGVLDILQLIQIKQSNSFSLQPFFSTGTGAFVSGTASSFQGEQFQASNLYPLGLNGNGQTNVVASWLDTKKCWNFTVFSANPSGVFAQGASINSEQNMPQLSFFAGDATGSGKAGLFYTYTDSGNNIHVQPFPSAGPYPDLADGITDQLGNHLAISYAPLTDAAVYSETLPAYPVTTARQYPCILSPVQFPVQNVLGMAKYVVAGYTQTNDATVNRFAYGQSFTMQYKNARIDLTGRGWQGFQLVQQNNTGTGLTIIKNYLQAFPYTGSLAGQSKAQNGNQLLKLTVTTYQSVAFQSPGGNAASAAFAIQKTGTLEYYYNSGFSNFDSLTARSYAYDNYGNQTGRVWWGYIAYIDPTGINATAPFPTVTPLAANEVLYRYRQYQNDVLASGWALGYLLYEKQSANSTDADITSFLPGDYNLSACTYTAQTYNLATRGAWDSQNNVMLTTSFTYDSFGNQKTETRPGNATTQYTYDTTYNTYRDTMTAPPNAQGTSLTTSYGYDPRFGQLVAQQDANGNTSIVALDGFGRKVTEQGPVPAGCTQSDANQCTAYVTGSVAFGGATVLTLKTMVYANDGNGGIYLQGSVLQEFPADANRVWNEHYKYIDGKGRTVQVAVEAGGNNGYSLQVTTYGAYKRPLSKSLPFYHASLSLTLPVDVPATVFTYDALERMRSKQTPTGADNSVLVTATWDYSTWGQTTITEASGTSAAYVQVVSRHYYNGKPQQLQSVLPNDGNATTTFVYDALGRMTSVTDPQGLQNTLVYDSLGRKVNYNNPDQNPQFRSPGALQYQYDPVTGAIQTITDVAACAVTYTYDALGRVVTQAYTDGRQIAYTYDTGTNGAGQLAAVEISSAGYIASQKALGYDVYGNNNQETLTVNGVPYNTASVFDPLKRLVGQTYNDGTTLTRSYQYGLLVAQQLENVTINYPIDAYNANGRFGEVQYDYEGNNVLTANYTYNSAGTAYAETFVNSDEEELLDFSYTYDPLNELVTSEESIAGNRQTYGYTNKRIQTVGGSAGMPTGSYSYDSSGRMTGNNNNIYTYQGSNCPLTITGGVQYSITQDLCGRVAVRTVNGETLSFVYAASGDLIMIMQGGNIYRALEYDEQGNRIQEAFADGVTGVYVNAAFRVYTNLSGATTIVKTIMDGAGMVATLSTTGSESTALFYRRDQKKNVTHTFNSSGVLQSAFAFDGFGNATPIMSSRNPPPFYEGRTQDPGTGLYYFGARHYDPLTGTFIKPDSRLGAKNKLTAGAWNRFAFELNNPVNQLDPSGHHSIWADIGLAVGAVALVAVTAVALVLTVPTGGASDAAALELDADLGTLELGELGLDAGADAAADGGGDAAADASADAAADAGADAAGGGGSTESGGGLGKTLVRVGVRLGTNAVKGAVTGAITNGVEYEVESGFKGSWSGLLKAMETGAISGAVSGVVAGELTAMVNLSDYSLFGRMAVQGIAGAAGSVSGKIVSTEIMDQQFPSATTLAESAASGFATGALLDKDNLMGLKNYVFPPAAAGPIEIELTDFSLNV